MKNFSFTPIIACFSNLIWNNDNIDNIVKDNLVLSDINLDCYDGNLIRFMLDLDNAYFQVIAVCSDEEFEYILKMKSTKTNFLKILYRLTEFEDEGYLEFISKVNFDHIKMNYSPDVCVHKYDDIWEFSS